MIKKVLLLISLIFLVDAVFATTYYLQVINPNDYDLTNFQIKLNLTKYNIEPPIAQITTLDGSNIPFCYEQSNGECNETESNIIWVKIPLIKGKDYTVVKVVVNGTNGATNGYQVFDFYEDFNTFQGWVGFDDWFDNDGQIDYSVHDGIIEINRNGEAGAFAKDLGFTIDKHGKWLIEYRGKTGKTSGEGEVTLEIADSYPSRQNEFQLHPFNTGGTPNYWSFRVGYMYQGTVYWTSNVLDNLPYNTWCKFIIKISEDKIYAKEECENGLVQENSLSIDPSHEPYGRYVIIRGCCQDNPRHAIYDWIRVRKYADQDPIVKVAYSQSSSSPQSPTQTSTEYNQTYLYVRQVTVLPENSVSISNAQIILELDTQSLISEGKLQSDCSDIYITYYDPLYGELPAKFWVDPTTCNTKATRIYVKLPTISVNNDWIINVYYGSPGAIPMWDPKNTFTFYVDLTNPSDISQNLIIRTEGTTTLDYTSSGLVIQTGSDGKVLIVNK